VSTQQKQKNRPPEKFRLPLDKDGNVIIPKDKDGNPDYGAVMRYFRLFVKGWSSRYLAIRYTEVLREQGEDEDEAITARWIQLMEKENQVPKDPKRRWVLAMLLGIPAASFGLKELNQPPKVLTKTLHLILKREPINVKEYRTTLERYCASWGELGNFSEILQNILHRISSLQNEAFSTRSPEKQELLQLWCEYHILAANIALSHYRFDEAITLLDRAIIVAEDNQLYTVLSYGFRERGLVYLDKGEITAITYGYEAAKPDFDAAISTFNEAIKLEGLVSAQRHALTVLLAGGAHAHVAQSQKQLATALHMIDEAGKAIGSETDDKRIPARLDEERYHLDKAYAYLASPVKTLRFPQRAREKELDEAMKRTQGFKTRHAENAFLQAKSYFVAGEYEMATTHAQLAIPFVQDLINSPINFARLDALHQGLLKSPFGQSDAVAELGIKLLKAQKPHLFT